MRRPEKPVRVRFAPSPTGFLHIGSARTALFNFIFAKKYEGKFVLRIEDTDRERSRQEFEEDIITSLRWLGIEWDEGPDNGGDFGPYRQSERAEIYEKYLRKLLDENRAYYCFCSKEELEKDRQMMLAQGLSPKYGGRCRNLSEEEREKHIKENTESVMRIKMPEAKISFIDIIRGKVEFDASLFGDIVIAKDVRAPLYNFAVVVDDFEMRITHVIRGEDHLSNTPKQIVFQKILGFEDVKYAHLPLILAPNRSKMSKRFMETSLNEYRKGGYLPEAVVNFLALLGWHPGLTDKEKGERELFSLGDLIERFDFKSIQKAGAVFNIEKLEWFNAQYIRRASAERLVELLVGFLPEEWHKNRQTLIKIVALERERAERLTDFYSLSEFFFSLPEYPPKLLFWQPERSIDESDTAKKTREALQIVRREIDSVFKVDFTRSNLEKRIMPITEVWGRGAILWPLRVTLSGQPASPPPFEIMDILGKEETLKRINLAIEKLENI